MRAYAAMAQPYHGEPQARHMSPQPFGFGRDHNTGARGEIHPLALARIHRHAAHLHGLGPRAVAEALAELATDPLVAEAVLGLLARYSRLSREQIAWAGADRPLPRQLTVVP